MKVRLNRLSCLSGYSITVHTSWRSVMNRSRQQSTGFRDLACNRQWTLHVSCGFRDLFGTCIINVIKCSPRMYEGNIVFYKPKSHQPPATSRRFHTHIYTNKINDFLPGRLFVNEYLYRIRSYTLYSI